MVSSSDRDQQLEFSEKTKDYYRYVENYNWTYAADHFVGLESLLHRGRERVTWALIRNHLPSSGKCLDVGCGTGLMLRHMPAGSVGIDINPRNLEKARRYAPAAVLVQGDVEAMPFPPESFDGAVCSEVIEHLPNPQKAVDEIFRVLKPDAPFVGTVPYPSFFWRLRFLSHKPHDGEPFHNEFRLPEVRGFLRRFRILQMKRANVGMNVVFVAQKP